LRLLLIVLLPPFFPFSSTLGDIWAISKLLP
jgi:hypothetical protein